MVRSEDLDFAPIYRELLYELNLPDVEIQAVYPANERAIRVYIVQRLRLKRWEDFARLINSDTE